MRVFCKIVFWIDKELDGKGKEVYLVTTITYALEYEVLLVAIGNLKIQKEALDTRRAVEIPNFDEEKIILG